jgi:hypothetical protein
MAEGGYNMSSHNVYDDRMQQQEGFLINKNKSIFICFS